MIWNPSPRDHKCMFYLIVWKAGGHGSKNPKFESIRCHDGIDYYKSTICIDYFIQSSDFIIDPSRFFAISIKTVSFQ